MWKNFAKEYFSFTRKERGGIYTLLVIIFLCIMLPFFFPYFIHQKKYDHTEFDKAISELKIREDSTEKIKPAMNYRIRNRNNYPGNSNSYRSIQGELFYFDPNTISGSAWKQLGIREKTISTIQKYLSKGGHFYKAGDLRKIWGLHEEEVMRLIPFVRINEKRVSKLFNTKGYTASFKSYHKADQKPFDVNTADSATLDSLPGIGPRLAKRIIAFRDKLGGFTSVEQVKETYALPDSTFNKIKPKFFIGNHELKKMNINTSSVDQLKTHPYIRYAIANAIVQYRSQHGSYKSIADIKNIMIITDDIYDKIIPYLTVKD